MQRCLLAIFTLAFCAGAQAASEDVSLNLVTSQSVGQAVGSVKITETDRGLEFTPDLRALPPGKHGFHIHAEGSCQPAIKDGKAVAAGAAGGHFDPQHTGKHEGPLGAGHLGDLPLLVVNDNGVANQPVIAPRLKTLAEVKGKALMVHVGGDNIGNSSVGRARP
uniref:superoxide dismutase family protein n=1 Tax=Klebsiella aerogenes TaxID=548 RepID=UPI0006666FB5